VQSDRICGLADRFQASSGTLDVPGANRELSEIESALQYDPEIGRGVVRLLVESTRRLLIAAEMGIIALNAFDFSFSTSEYPDAATTTVNSPVRSTTNSATPLDVSRCPLGTPPRNSLTTADDGNACPEASCNLTVMTEPLPKNSFSSLPASWAVRDGTNTRRGSEERQARLREPGRALLGVRWT
jgi:hypothetical protein